VATGGGALRIEDVCTTAPSPAAATNIVTVAKDEEEVLKLRFLQNKKEKKQAKKLRRR